MGWSGVPPDLPTCLARLPALLPFMDLVDRVRRTIGRHRLAAADTRVVVAVSGGSDSVALAHVLALLERSGELRLVGLAHFNHQLREAALADEAFCVSLAAVLGRPLVVDRADVGAAARRERQSLEVAARAARHAFFGRARAQFGADVVALGHTKDDQAETLLLRLLRGAGVRGLAAMHPRRGPIVRPLLDCRRAELREFLAARQIRFVHDESNDDVSIPRNRVRAELLPLLERRFNPSVVDVLADEAEIARDEHQYFEALADDLWPQIARRDGSRWLLDVQALGHAPLPIARVLLRRAMVGAAAGRAVAFADVERALQLVAAAGPSLDGPGQRVQRIGPDLVLTGRVPGVPGRPVMPEPQPFRYSLPVPGEVLVAESACLVSAELAGADVGRALAGRDGEATVRLDRCTGTLAVRSRQPGDRFQPAGLAGRKKLQDFFVDRKVARDRRDRVPIVVDASDRIVWVGGYAIDDAFRVTDPSQAVLVLRLKGVGGSD